MKDWTLEIETQKHLIKIRNPRKAKDTDWILRCVVQVMDENGKWHFIGHCFHPTDALLAADEINEAIRNKNKLVVVEDLI